MVWWGRAVTPFFGFMQALMQAHLPTGAKPLSLQLVHQHSEILDELMFGNRAIPFRCGIL